MWLVSRNHYAEGHSARFQKIMTSVKYTDGYRTNGPRGADDETLSHDSTHTTFCLGFRGVLDGCQPFG